MSHFLRLSKETDKAEAMLKVCNSVRYGLLDQRHFNVNPRVFDTLPGKPFAYWVSEELIETYSRLPAFGEEGRAAWIGLQTNDDFQWLRLWWESASINSELFQLKPIAKGGSYSLFYADIYLCVRWGVNGQLIKIWKSEQVRKGLITANNSKCWNEKDYFRPGITWSLRTTKGLSIRVLPAGCIFGNKGPAAFIPGNDSGRLMAMLGLLNSSTFNALVNLKVAATDAAARSYDVGILEKTSIPQEEQLWSTSLSRLAKRFWSLKRNLDSVLETSHAFVLPLILRARLGDFNVLDIEAELVNIRAEIDTVAFNLYGFKESEQNAVLEQAGEESNYRDEDESNEVNEPDITPIDGLLSWAIGVAFGHFDVRLATGQREMPPEPEPFDPLPSKSPGMLPVEAEPFYRHGGILLDDQGHRHDLPHLIEEVLNRVSVPVPDNVRRWLQKDFFTFHLKLYSKSRRKAPIYWPLSTASGSYTLWIYYPSLTSQTLFTAVNDFLDGPNGKLTQVSRECTELRQKGSSRSSDDEKRYDMLQTFEQELTDLRDTLLKIAPMYQPNHDDGVQITAAPLWPLFRHKPWQKLLKDTWTKLEKGDYDWAHLAMNYWPERVREKCKTDKSLAIAHGLESIYVEPEVAPKKTRSKKKAETDK